MLNISLVNRVLIWLVVAVGLFFALPNAFYGRVETHNDAVKAIEATGSTPELEAAAGVWPDWMPGTLVNLGLDLRGGASLLAEVQVEEVYASRMDALWPEVRDVLRAERAAIGGIRRIQQGPADELRVRIENPAEMGRVLTAIRALARPVQSLTGVGTTDIEVDASGAILTINLSEAERQIIADLTLQQALEIIRRRVDAAGTREPSIQRQGSDRVLVQVPGLGSAQELKELIGTTAKLTFHSVVSVTDDPNASPGPGNILHPSAEQAGEYFVLERLPVISGEDLTDSQPEFDQNGRPAVGFRFNPGGARIFCGYTTENAGAPFAIVLDDEVISAPRINEPICGGAGIITGNFSVEESTNLSIQLRAGSLPAAMEFLQENTIGADLGKDSIDAGIMACMVAFAAVLIFMLLSYGTFGIFANIALIVNVGMIFGLLSVFGATLTLPGIAGIVLTIGMAVDANVLVFERIREELKSAKGPSRAIELGYEKALSAIIDANITTFITAVILFALGSGPVKGFSVTLMIGIATSVFTAIYVTRVMVVIWFEARRPKTIEV
ncbi:protein translocase subunit SecD [Actibacterium sp. 188UL27-1]|uniref:protein translocase subunit SecD n=1 Tax=Actibacterium sp. 188UL27-1 TaxID=2786961 RepID=UPI00195A014D|nr:protein translocase subunit SecD [Actibacterium sp. 188UL27-1]MBM7066689.1 protein translocase subunit SecD [Actibacterium sp. 188UL27-1]